MTELAKVLGASLKKKSELIGLVERHLLAGPEVTERRTDCIHPSEAAHEDWCPRATYYRISGETPEPAIRKLHNVIHVSGWLTAQHATVLIPAANFRPYISPVSE